MHPDEHGALHQNFLRSLEETEGQYPYNLEEQFPGILKKIILLWGSPEIDPFFSHLLLDTRGGRAGFTAEVMREIFKLQNLHGRLFPKGIIDHWEHIGRNFDYDTVRQATRAAIELNKTSHKISELHRIASKPAAVNPPRTEQADMAEGQLLAAMGRLEPTLTAAEPEIATPSKAAHKPKAILAPSPQKKMPDTLGITTFHQLRDALNKKSAPLFESKLGEVLVREKIVTQEQLEEALADQDKHKIGYLGKSLIKLGFATEEEIERIAAKRLGLVFVNLALFQIDPEATKLVPYEVAFKQRAIPLCIMGINLVVAVENPMDFQGSEILAFTTEKVICLVGASAKNILSRLENYGESTSVETKLVDVQSFVEMATDEGNKASFEMSLIEPNDDAIEAAVSDNAVVKMVNKMIIDAVDQGVSDIHLESKLDSKTLKIRFRKDGNLFPYYVLPHNYRNPVISRIKIMCQLNITERRKPQDGKILFNCPGKGKIELRVATVPTSGGTEDVVMRLLPSGEVTPMDKIGLSELNYHKLLEIIAKPYGILLVCGPTGSGKTTTLHSLLHEISKPEIKIWTVEDPVEINQDHLSQVQVNEKIGLDFASVIRAFLRADPDVIMIGEMRDQETCKVALQASLTGHLVLSTLHTNSAAESITRLLEMGMDPFNFADAFLGVLAQRLAQKLCSDCKSGYHASETELIEMAEEFASVASIETKHHRIDYQEIVARWRKLFGGEDGEITLYRPTGCANCNHTGLHGRFGLHELIVTSPEVKNLIRQKTAVTDILLESMAGGTSTLKQDGIEKVLKGITTIHEVRAACG